MKKLFILLIVSSIITSCSSDGDSSSDENPNQELESELTHYVLKFPSGNVTRHNFNGSKATDSNKNDIQTLGFEYDTNDKMSKYIRYEADGSTIEASYTFNYDNAGKITSIDEFNAIGSFFIPESFTRALTYEGNSIKTTFPKDNTDNYDEEFILNDKGLLKEYIRLNPDGSLETKLVFKYDSNNNCTILDITSKSLPSGELTTLQYQYTYDDNPNPLYSHYKDYYLQNIFVYTRRNFVNFSILNLIRTFGKNNYTKVIYPNEIPEAARFTYEYDYNGTSYPEKVITKNVASGAITVETEFYYK